LDDAWYFGIMTTIDDCFMYCLFQDFMVGALAKARGGDLKGAKSTVDYFFAGYERRVAAEASPEERLFFYFSLQRK
jgi:hypothetical protein